MSTCFISVSNIYHPKQGFASPLLIGIDVEINISNISNELHTYLIKWGFIKNIFGIYSLILFNQNINEKEQNIMQNDLKNAFTSLGFEVQYA